MFVCPVHIPRHICQTPRRFCLLNLSASRLRAARARRVCLQCAPSLVDFTVLLCSLLRCPISTGATMGRKLAALNALDQPYTFIIPVFK